MSKGEEKRILSCSPTISLKPKRYECRVPDRLRSHLILYVKVVIMVSPVSDYNARRLIGWIVDVPVLTNYPLAPF